MILISCSVNYSQKKDQLSKTQLSSSDFNEFLVCYSPNKNKRYVFFYMCPYELLRGKTLLGKKLIFLFRSKYRRTVRDRKKFLKMKIEWLQEYFRTIIKKNFF